MVWIWDLNSSRLLLRMLFYLRYYCAKQAPGTYFQVKDQRDYRIYRYVSLSFSLPVLPSLTVTIETNQTLIAYLKLLE